MEYEEFVRLWAEFSDGAFGFVGITGGGVLTG